MPKRRLWKDARLLLLAGGIPALVLGGVAWSAGTVHAITSSSSHYQVDSAQFGNGSSAQTCSTQYCSSGGVSSVAGQTIGASSTATFGTSTGSEPVLDVSITGGASDLGVLTAQSTTTKTTLVKVRSYLSGGYVLQILGNPPSYDGHTLATPSTPTASVVGTEQFGINAVANTSPLVGANVAQVPSITTSFGVVSPNYATPNLFMYSSGDTVASSPKASGETDFTISMILNISNTTPAGHYSGDFSAVVIPTY